MTQPILHKLHLCCVGPIFKLCDQMALPYCEHNGFDLLVAFASVIIRQHSSRSYRFRLFDCHHALSGPNRILNMNRSILLEASFLFNRANLRFVAAHSRGLRLDDQASYVMILNRKKNLPVASSS
jgi:hypothetical protein